MDVKGPDGDIYRFPDTMNDDQVLSVMRSKFGGPKQEAAKQPEAMAFDANGSPTGIAPSEMAPNKVPYSEQMAGVGKLVDSSVRSLANGLPFMDRIAAAAGAATGLAGEVGDYSGNLEHQRARDEQDRKAAPVATTVGNLIGGAAVPLGAIGAASKAASLPAKMLAGGGAGAAIGAVQGLSDTKDLTDVRDDLRHAAIGGVTGAVVGGAIPAVARGIGSTYRAVAGRAADETGIDRAASSKLTEALQADSPEAVKARLSSLGNDAMLVDAGPSLQGLGQGVAVRPGEGRSIVTNALKERNAGTYPRLQSDVNETLGPAESAIQKTQDILSTRSAGHADLAPIFENAPPVQIPNVLQTIGQKLNKAVGPEASALQQIKGWLTKGEDPKTGMPIYHDDAETLSNVKTAIDKLINYGDPSLGVTPGMVSKTQGAISDVRKSLSAALKLQVPGYEKAMEKSSGLAKEAEALERGTQLLGTGHENHPALVEQFLARLTPEQRKAAELGLRSEIDRKIGTTSNDLSAGKNIIKGEGDWNRANLEQAFGKEAADKLIGSVDREVTFRDAVNKIIENSQTAQRSEAAKGLDTKPLLDLGKRDSFYGDAKLALRKLLGAATTPNTSARDAALAQILTMRGPERDKTLSALMDLLGRNNEVNGRAANAGNIGALLSGTLANGQVRQNVR